MGQFLFYYQRPEPATWVYMSSFLVVGIFFMFHRFWSIRNLDVLLLLLLTPGLMLVYESYQVRPTPSVALADQQDAALINGKSKQLVVAQPERVPQQFVDEVKPNPKADRPDEAQRVGMRSMWTAKHIRLFGYIWLLSVCGLLLTRMLIDTTFFRRPHLDPNLSRGGLMFIGISLFAFLIANVLNSPPEQKEKIQINRGPGYVPLKVLPDISTTAQTSAAIQEVIGKPDATVSQDKQVRFLAVSRTFLTIANCLLVLSIVGIGYWHFNDLRSGIGAATLYLLLPYAAQMIGRVEHAVPGALIVVAVLLYRRPFFSGAAIGLAGGLVFYPLFLFPLWLSFYWKRGQRRFIAGVALSLIGLIISVISVYPQDYLMHTRYIFGLVPFAITDLDGIWGLGVQPYVRIPVLVAFVALAFSFAFWPAQKSLATLINCSAAVMVTAQFCHAYGGGLLMAWYLPLVLLAVFRPNLDDLVASQAVRKFRRFTRKEPPAVPLETSTES
jgi:hypothetical protein